MHVVMLYFIFSEYDHFEDVFIILYTDYCIFNVAFIMALNLGLILCDILRNYQEAADRFSVAIKHNPGVAQYYGNRAKALGRMQRTEEAKQDALCALILDPADEEASLSAPYHPYRNKNKLRFQLYFPMVYSFTLIVRNIVYSRH